MPYTNTMKTIELTVIVLEEDVALLRDLGDKSYREVTERDLKVYRTLGWKLARAVLYAYEHRRC